MILAVILILLVLLVIGLLFLPLEFYIDTQTEQYYVKFGGLAKARIEGHDTEVIVIKIQAFFTQFEYFPLRRESKLKKKSKSTQVNRVEQSKKGVRKLKTLWRVVRSFKVQQFHLDVDTGDCISNAKLYPVFALMNYHWGGFWVNFEGRNRLVVHITNRPIYIIRSFINV